MTTEHSGIPRSKLAARRSERNCLGYWGCLLHKPAPSIDLVVPYRTHPDVVTEPHYQVGKLCSRRQRFRNVGALDGSRCPRAPSRALLHYRLTNPRGCIAKEHALLSRSRIANLQELKANNLALTVPHTMDVRDDHTLGVSLRKLPFACSTHRSSSAVDGIRSRGCGQLGETTQQTVCGKNDRRFEGAKGASVQGGGSQSRAITKKHVELNGTHAPDLEMRGAQT